MENMPLVTLYMLAAMSKVIFFTYRRISAGITISTARLPPPLMTATIKPFLLHLSLLIIIV